MLALGGGVWLTGNSAATWGSPLRAYTGGPDGRVARLIDYGAIDSWLDTKQLINAPDTCSNSDCRQSNNEFRTQGHQGE